MIHIFLETDTPKGNKWSTEARFIKTIIEQTQNKKYNIDFDIIGFEGYTKLEPARNLLLKYPSIDINLIIFDADTPQTKGGFTARLKYITDIQKKYLLPFKLFLWTNNKDDGIFENLLETLVTSENQRVIDYFKEYEAKINNAIDKNGNHPYEAPDQKTRMYAYISAFKRSNNEKEDFKNKKDWNFSNPKYWNLQAVTLQPLLNFLKNNI